MQAYVGRRWIELDHRGIQSTEFGASYLERLAELPLAIGLKSSIQEHRDGDFAGAEKFFGYEVGLEGMSWIPDDVVRSRLYRPFLKYEYSLVSEHQAVGNFNGQPYEYRYGGLGTNLTLGINLNYSPEFRIILAVVQGEAAWKLKKVSGAGDWPKVEGAFYLANSRAVLLAMEFPN